MDALMQNNLADGLEKVAGIYGQYAAAAHQDRMDQAKQAYQDALDQQKQNAEDARHNQDVQIKTSEFAQTSAQKDAELKQRAADAAAARQDTASYHAGMLGIDSSKLGIESQRLSNERTKSVEDKQAQLQQNLLKAYDVHQQHTQTALDRANAAMQNEINASHKAIMSPDEMAKNDAVIMAKHQPIIDAAQKTLEVAQKNYDALNLKLNGIAPDSGTPSGSGTPGTSGAAPTMPAPAAPPQIKKGPDGKLYTRDPSGKIVPYTGAPTADTSGSASSDPMAQMQQSNQIDQTAMDSSQPPGGQDPNAVPPLTGADPSQLNQNQMS